MTISEDEQKQASHPGLHWSARRINKLAAALGAVRYVEIGVSKGITFHAIKIAQRTAVDPKFAFDTIDFQNADTQFFEVTSDQYFQHLASDVAPDIYYLDGLHTFEQTLRDFNNSVVHSHSRTVWLIDDTRPIDVFSTLTDPKQTLLFRHETGNNGLAWHGDVFKLVCYIHDFMPTLNYQTLVGSGNGQTLVWRSNRYRRIPRFNNLEAISRLTYFDFRENRNMFNECNEDEAIKTCISEVMGGFGSALPGGEVVDKSTMHVLGGPGDDATPERITSLSDVYVEPYVFQPFDPDRRKPACFSGGIEAGKASRFARMAWSGGYRDQPQSRRELTGLPIPGRSLFAGPLWNHFGHILTESIHRLWPLIEDRYDRIVFTGVIGLRGVMSAEDLRSAEVPATAKAIFAAMELPDVELFLVREPVVFAALDVSEPGARYRDGVQPFYLKYLRKYQDRITGRMPEYSGPRNLYYSRRHILAQGGIIGSSYFEEAMAKSGIVSVIPENMTIDEQLNHLLNAERVVFDEGSSVHLVELLGHLPGSFYMLPRRPGDMVFRSAFRNRALFHNLATDDNVGVLPDKYGETATPAALAFYKRPAEVFDALSRNELVAGAFDYERYRECEAADLALCPFRNEQIRSARQAALAQFRHAMAAARREA